MLTSLLSLNKNKAVSHLTVERRTICVVASAASTGGAVYTAMSLVGDVQALATATLAASAVFFALAALCLKPAD
jgi:hypothetical protein